MARNSRNGCLLSDNVAVAGRIHERMKGLIGKNELKKGESLLIIPCKGIHTFGMRFPLDVLFLDSENRIVLIKEHMPPNRLTPLSLKAKSALELPAGTVSETGTRLGDEVSFVGNERT